MAKITFKDAVKDVEGKVHFAFGNSEFDLEPGGSFETNNADAITGANGHPLLQVEAETGNFVEWAEAEVERLKNSTDPHENPRVDHMNVLADPAVVEAAQQRVTETREAVDTRPVVEDSDAKPAPDPVPLTLAPVAPAPTTEGQNS